MSHVPRTQHHHLSQFLVRILYKFHLFRFYKSRVVFMPKPIAIDGFPVICIRCDNYVDKTRNININVRLGVHDGICCNIIIIRLVPRRTYVPVKVRPLSCSVSTIVTEIIFGLILKSTDTIAGVHFQDFSNRCHFGATMFTFLCRALKRIGDLKIASCHYVILQTTELS